MELAKLEKKCHFCSKLNANYTCPRCNATYCSKSCYQSSSHLECSEQFYQQCVEQELHLNSVDDDSKKQMLEILNRLQEKSDLEDEFKDSDDEDSLPDLYERLENIDLDDADEVWNRLSEQEKLEFQAILNSGDVGHLIPEYHPWWCQRYQKNVEELDDFLNQKNKQQYKALCPTIKLIVPFSSISKVPPSPCILPNIVNVLGSYAFVVRRYIGEHHDFCIEVLNILTSICENLNSNQNFESIQSAIDNVKFHITSNPEFACSKEEANVINDDINWFLAGPENSEAAFYILAALSDLQEILTKALLEKKKKKANGEFSKKYPKLTQQVVDKSKVRLIAKKLDFYLSWVNDYYHDFS